MLRVKSNARFYYAVFRLIIVCHISTIRDDMDAESSLICIRNTNLLCLNSLICAVMISRYWIDISNPMTFATLGQTWSC